MKFFGELKYPSIVWKEEDEPSKYDNNAPEVGETTPISVTIDVMTLVMRTSAALGLRSFNDSAASTE